MTCPLCGQQHKEGTDYCPVLLAAIPAPKPSDEPFEQESIEALEDNGVGDHRLATCENCGYVGIVGEQCDQCGQVILVGGSVLAEMPNGSQILLPVSEEIVIGRESCREDVADALSRCDGVSRRHCTVRFDSRGKCVTVIDLGSTNGTWIGSDNEPLKSNEVFTGRLPIELHLGKRATIVLREG